MPAFKNFRPIRFVVSDCICQHRHVGARCFADFGYSIDEGDLGGQEGVGRSLHQLRSSEISHDERDFLVEQLRVNVPSQSFRSSRLRPINSEDQSIRIQRVP